MKILWRFEEFRLLHAYAENLKNKVDYLEGKIEKLEAKTADIEGKLEGLEKQQTQEYNTNVILDEWLNGSRE